MTSKHPTWRDVKKIVGEWSTDQLVGLVQDLYRFDTANADFLHARLLSASAGQDGLAPYKERIRKAVSPAQPWKQDVRLADGRKAISDYKKANGDARGQLTLMVYYVQCGNDFTLEFGDIDEAFYDSLCSMVEGIKERLLTADDTALAAEFLPMVVKEFERIDGQMGWGYPDEVSGHLEELRMHFG
jgi:hypothetical protein